LCIFIMPDASVFEKVWAISPPQLGGEKGLAVRSGGERSIRRGCERSY